ncbi:cryptochrome-1-like [Diaphorina citri]|uniref:Cryptochrome-1-like n=1 Tax=Diaphorina citri TaxID=121845 RepID=A0A1S3DS20_DIACI|nr:cryptochrome-1-like [Diaphorina citri]
MYLHTVSCIGLPPRPKEDIDFRHVTFGTMSESLQREVSLFQTVPKPEQFHKYPETDFGDPLIRWLGGETEALIKLNERLSQVNEN